jgi:hypothetical protein
MVPAVSYHSTRLALTPNPRGPSPGGRGEELSAALGGGGLVPLSRRERG